MTCYHPLLGYRSIERNEKTGKRPIVFDASKGYPELPVKLPCGRCVGCRLDRSRQWAMRCVHEAQMHENNCFITLTYNDDNLPDHKSLKMSDFQKFMKRLRKNSDAKIRFFHCGEYGDTTARPHYHACLFGYDFPDKQLWKVNNDNRLYTSEFLNDTWGLGYAVIGDVTFESAAYVARYIMKKINGDMAQDHYAVTDPETGEVLAMRQPEYTTMSRRKGIGQSWMEQFQTDVYPNDYVIMRGIKMKPPKYYDRLYELINPESLQKIKHARMVASKQNPENNTRERLLVRETVKIAQISTLKRNTD